MSQETGIELKRDMNFSVKTDPIPFCCSLTGRLPTGTPTPSIRGYFLDIFLGFLGYRHGAERTCTPFPESFADLRYYGGLSMLDASWMLAAVCFPKAKAEAKTQSLMKREASLRV